MEGREHLAQIASNQMDALGAADRLNHAVVSHGLGNTRTSHHVASRQHDQHRDQKKFNWLHIPYHKPLHPTILRHFIQ